MNLMQSLNILEKKQHILFLTTSNRWIGEKDHPPKSTQLAYALAKKLGKKATIIEIPALTIYPCEGNVSSAEGNLCGLKDALLQDKEKNPSGQHRCWVSLNNPDDELWKVSRELLRSDCVLFFGSIRWGQMNSIYQKLIERLTWLENRHSTLGEENILKDISAGIFITGQNWRGKEVMEVQKEVLGYFGFHVEEDLCGYWQYLQDSNDESPESYKNAIPAFEDEVRKKVE